MRMRHTLRCRDGRGALISRCGIAAGMLTQVVCWVPYMMDDVQVAGLRGVFDWGGGVLLRRVLHPPDDRSPAAQVRALLQVRS